MKSLIKILTAIALAGVMSGASATSLTFGINLNGSVSVNTGDITLLTTTKKIPTADTVSSCLDIDPGACALAGIAALGAATFSTGTLNTFLGPDAFTITAGLLTFSFTDAVLASITASGANTAGNISLQFNGSITSPGAFFGQTVSLSESCTQVKKTAIITCSESVITPGIPVETPEPISLALVGMGLVALGFVRRKRA
jgi:hypothetical protein